MKKERRTVRLNTKTAVLCAAASLLVPLAAQPASATVNPNDPNTPTISSHDYTPTPGNTIAFKPTGPTQGGNPVQLTGCWTNNSLGNLVPCGGGGGGGSSPPYVPPPPPPATPARPAAPAPPPAVMECRTVPPLHHDLIAEVLFTADANTATARYEYRVLWGNSRSASLSASVQAQLNAAAAALAHAQLASTQQAAIDAAAAAQAARDAADAAAEAEHDAQIAFDAVDAAATAALQHRATAHAASQGAQAAADDAEAAIAGLRTQPAPTLTPATYTADTTLTADLHVSQALIASLTAQAARQAAEDERDTALEQAALADSPAHPAALTAVAAADAAAEAAQQSADAYSVAEAHFVAVWQMRNDADAVLRDAQAASLAAQIAVPVAEAAADAAAEAADVDTAQQALDTLTVAASPSVIVLDSSPTITGTTGTSVVAHPLINDLDKLRAAVAVRTSVRAVASGPGGTRYSAWSDWSHWSDWSEWTNDRGDQWTDTDNNGQYDPGEPYTDTNGNGHYDPSAGCPIRTTQITPLNPNPCPHDPTLQAAVYPAGHAEPYTDTNGNGSWDAGEPYTDIDEDGHWTADLHGYPTGFCFPPTIGNPPRPHPCLEPSALCLGTGS